MTELEALNWPPEPIRTERLLLRQTRASDRAGYLELLCSDSVRQHLGGALDREVVDRAMPPVPGRYPGLFAVEHDGRFIGTVTLERRDPDRPGHTRAEGGELEVSYTFLPDAWGHGFAFEAVSAVLAWAAGHQPGEPVVLCTQVANTRAMRLAQRLGFAGVERFTEFDAEQWFGVLGLPRASASQCDWGTRRT